MGSRVEVVRRGDIEKGRKGAQVNEGRWRVVEKKEAGSDWQREGVDVRSEKERRATRSRRLPHRDGRFLRGKLSCIFHFDLLSDFCVFGCSWRDRSSEPNRGALLANPSSEFLQQPSRPLRNNFHRHPSHETGSP